MSGDRRLTSTISEERRAQRRFSICLPMVYKTTGFSGEGRVNDLSRNGIGFLTAGPLQIGAEIELEIRLPFERNGGPVRLSLQGKVVRSELGFAAARLFRRAFQVAEARRYFVAGGR